MSITLLLSPFTSSPCPSTTPSVAWTSTSPWVALSWWPDTRYTPRAETAWPQWPPTCTMATAWPLWVRRVDGWRRWVQWWICIKGWLEISLCHFPLFWWWLPQRLTHFFGSLKSSSWTWIVTHLGTHSYTHLSGYNVFTAGYWQYSTCF